MMMRKGKMIKRRGGFTNRGFGNLMREFVELIEVVMILVAATTTTTVISITTSGGGGAAASRIMIGIRIRKRVPR